MVLLVVPAITEAGILITIAQVLCLEGRNLVDVLGLLHLFLANNTMEFRASDLQIVLTLFLQGTNLGSLFVLDH